MNISYHLSWSHVKMCSEQCMNIFYCSYEASHYCRMVVMPGISCLISQLSSLGAKLSHQDRDIWGQEVTNSRISPNVAVLLGLNFLGKSHRHSQMFKKISIQVSIFKAQCAQIVAMPLLGLSLSVGNSLIPLAVVICMTVDI